MVLGCIYVPANGSNGPNGYGYGLCLSILMKETVTTHKQQPIVIANAMTNKPEPQKWSYMVPYSYKGVNTVLGDHLGPLYGPVWSCKVLISWVKFQLQLQFVYTLSIF